MGVVTAATIAPDRPFQPYAMPISLATAWRMAVLILFAGWVFWVGSYHEPWFDEAQAWLVARDNDLWPLLAERVRYEGTPGLWHVILWLVIRAGLPFSYLFLVSASFALAGAAVVLWRAPFPVSLRLAVLASYFFGYQFSIVARSYSIDLLLIPLAATFFATRVERPLRYALVIGLIANTNAHGFIASGLLGLELACQLWRWNKWNSSSSIAALLLAGGLGLFALWSAWQPADNGYLRPDIRLGPVGSLLMFVCNAFIDRISLWSQAPSSLFDIFAGFMLSLLLQRPVVGLLMAGSNRLLASSVLGALIVFSVVVYSSPWHAGLLFLFWLFFLWIEWDTPITTKLRRNLIGSMAIICLVQASQSVRAGLWDISNVYSSGAAAAKAVNIYRARHPQNHIAAFGFKAFEAQPWTQNNLFDNYKKGAPRPSYILWARQEPWSARVNPILWQHLLDDRPELILASSIDLGGRQYDLLPQACHAGFGVKQLFPATMTWRGVAIEDQTLILFERGIQNGCNRSER